MTLADENRKGKMENLKFGVHGDGQYSGGQFNVLASFNVGILNALKENFLETDLVQNYVQKNILPNLMIGFNVFGFQMWETLMNYGSTQLMWSVDSIFYQNLSVIKKFYDNPKFVAASVTPADNEAVKNFFPNLNYIYLPHGVDANLWKYDQNIKKEHDIVFMSSIRDFEKQIQDLKNQLSPNIYKLFISMYDFAMANEKKTFWEIFVYFADIYNFDKKDLELYSFLFNNICYTVTHAKRVKLIKKLKDYNLKVYGSKLWEKYVEGNVQYMGEAELLQSIGIVKKSKIVLHLHPLQIAKGLHERVLNATSAGSFVISDENPTIMQSFGENMAYYNNNTFANLEKSIQYYLENETEREEKALKARKITLTSHIWRKRVQELLSLVS
ncbi:MAG: glycosyltransferase [Candidatus Gastranaerophilales bacterium]|nr:glycosyltransferase [Candidatus Gastranaerophilales bacterium]